MTPRRGLALATPHRLATEAGAEAFRAGGTAIDAALAAAVTLTVVAPQDCALGGDAIALVGLPDGTLRVVNGSGAAARAADAAALRRTHAAMPIRGVVPITVPGAVAGWESIAGLGGRLPWAQLFTAAIGHARNGAPTSAPLGRALARSSALVAADPGLGAVFAPGGTLLREGMALHQPALALSLEALADRGAAALYRGQLGAELVAGLRRLGSPLWPADLAEHASELAEPLRLTYAGLDVATAPPNSQGFALLELLAALEPLGAPPDPLGPELPMLAELCRLTAVDRDRHLADPRARPVPLRWLLGPERATTLLELARDAVPRRSVEPGALGCAAGGDTVAIVAIDDEGHAISLIQSLFWAFGAGVLEPSTGIICHNRGAGFSLRPDAPGELRGGARPPHSLMPVLVLRDGRVVGAHGTMGGLAQPQVHLQLLLHRLRGASAAAAVARPRWIVDEADQLLRVERDAGAAALAHADAELGARDDAAGHGQLACRDPTGGLDAGSDPRADGAGAVVIR